MVAGSLGVVDQQVWPGMRLEGIWGSAEKLEASEVSDAKRKMLYWFGKRLVWGSIKISVLLEVFYRLTVW
jgi:hypothetical protein